MRIRRVPGRVKCKTKECQKKIFKGSMGQRDYCASCRRERQRICSMLHKRKMRNDPNYKNEQKIKMGQYYKKFRIKILNGQYARNKAVKVMVLTHYGKGGKLQCCWKGCLVIDLDCLTLDHINDDGYKERKGKTDAGGGTSFFWKLVQKDFPRGFQTLCGSHQWKKEILRRRRNRGKIKS